VDQPLAPSDRRDHPRATGRSVTTPTNLVPPRILASTAASSKSSRSPQPANPAATSIQSIT